MKNTQVPELHAEAGSCWTAARFGPHQFEKPLTLSSPCARVFIYRFWPPLERCKRNQHVWDKVLAMLACKSNVKARDFTSSTWRSSWPMATKADLSGASFRRCTQLPAVSMVCTKWHKFKSCWRLWKIIGSRFFVRQNKFRTRPGHEHDVWPPQQVQKLQAANVSHHGALYREKSVPGGQRCLHSTWTAKATAQTSRRFVKVETLLLQCVEISMTERDCLLAAPGDSAWAAELLGTVEVSK